MNEKLPIDLLVSASWILPIVPRGRILQDCCVAIDRGQILALGLASELRARYQARKVVDLPNHVLMPGFVNAHGHAAMTLLRGYADDKPLMDWLENHIWPAEQAWVSEEFVADGTRLAIAEMLTSGTTCFSDMYFYPESAASVAVETGMRAQLCFPILDFPTAWASSADEYLRKGTALHDQYRSHDLVSIGFGPHAPYTVSDEPLQRIATYAEETQAPVQIHLHETAHEVSESIERYGMRPTERLHKLGLLSPLTQCVHMTQIDDTDIAILQESGAHVVHCPESNLKLASGICPVHQLLSKGVNVALGTDGAASNNDLCLSDEMRTAALIGKVAANDAAAVNAIAALEMATINGAKALGLANDIGSIEAGKQADLVAIELSDIGHQPMYDPFSHLVYTRTGHKVSHVWVKGKAMVEDYQLCTIDLESVKTKAGEWQHRLAKN